MTINWKVRFKNKVWLSLFLGLIIGFAFDMLKLLDVAPVVTESFVTNLVSKVLEFLGLIGVLVDPTTEGLGDSVRALGYNEPWKD